MTDTNIMTVDVEDWYQSSLDVLGPEHANLPRPIFPSDRVVINTRRLLNIFDEYNVKATCFILGTVTETYPNLVREINDSGHEVATHGYGHDLVYKLDPKQFQDDLKRSINLLKSITGKKVNGYRAPYFSITQESEWALDVLAKLNIEYDSSIFPIKRKLYGFPGRKSFPHNIITDNGRSLYELPVSTINIFGKILPIGGGGYFRLLPYSLVKKAISSINNKDQSAVFYLHPYELDTDELLKPLPNESKKTRFVRYCQRLNRDKTEAKLRKLLTDFNWTSAKEWINMHK